MDIDAKYVATNHCAERWSQRFSNYNFDKEWQSAKKATRKQRDVIKTHCVSNSSHGGNKDITYYISVNAIVFVCNDSMETIITVIPYVETVKSAKPTTNSSYREYKHNKRQTKQYGRYCHKAL